MRWQKALLLVFAVVWCCGIAKVNCDIEDRDKNKDGKIDDSEFGASKTSAAFACLDLDHDGTIDLRLERNQVRKQFRASRLSRLTSTELVNWMLNEQCIARNLTKYQEKLQESGWSGENMWKLAVTLENPGLTSVLGVTLEERDAISEAVCRECEGHGCLGAPLTSSSLINQVSVNGNGFVNTNGDDTTSSGGSGSSGGNNNGLGWLGWIWDNLGNVTTLMTVLVVLYSSVRINLMHGSQQQQQQQQRPNNINNNNSNNRHVAFTNHSSGNGYPLKTAMKSPGSSSNNNNNSQDSNLNDDPPSNLVRKLSQSQLTSPPISSTLLHQQQQLQQRKKLGFCDDILAVNSYEPVSSDEDDGEGEEEQNWRKVPRDSMVLRRPNSEQSLLKVEISSTDPSPRTDEYGTYIGSNRPRRKSTNDTSFSSTTTTTSSSGGAELFTRQDSMDSMIMRSPSEVDGAMVCAFAACGKKLSQKTSVLSILPWQKKKKGKQCPRCLQWFCRIHRKSFNHNCDG